METYEIGKGWEHLVNTEIPIRLGPPIGYTPVTVLIKPRIEVETDIKKSGLKLILAEPQDNPNAVIDPHYPHKDKLKKTAMLYRAEKE
jgi:hypothetical protein